MTNYLALTALLLIGGVLHYVKIQQAKHEEPNRVERLRKLLKAA